MTIKEYQTWTRKLVKYKKSAVEIKNAGLYYVALGLTGESGEVANKVKKIFRDKDSVVSVEDREDILDEVGDVLYYLARLCDELGGDIQEVINKNVEKLEDRQNRGAISGSGDNR